MRRRRGGGGLGEGEGEGLRGVGGRCVVRVRGQRCRWIWGLVAGLRVRMMGTLFVRLVVVVVERAMLRAWVEEVV